MKMDRLLAYSPNLKQSWMLMAISMVCTLIVVFVLSLVVNVIGITAVLAIMESKWRMLIISLMFVAVASVVVIYLGKDSSYVPIVPLRQSPLLWVLLVPFILSVNITAELLTMWIPGFGVFADNQYKNNLPTFLLMVVVSPVLEEWLSRGIILKGLLTHYSPLKAIAWSSVIFGVIHIDPRMAMSAFCVGLAIGWVYWRIRSLWCCIFMHATINMFAFLVMVRIPGKTTLVDFAGGGYIYAVVVVICVFTGMWIKNIIVSPVLTSGIRS